MNTPKNTVVNRSEQPRPDSDRTVTKTHQNTNLASKPLRRLSMTHQDYWLPKLKKRSYAKSDGKGTVEIPDWQIRLFHLGKESWFNRKR
jgi:hypothetical protein